jgi:hypothetical protein
MNFESASLNQNRRGKFVDDSADAAICDCPDFVCRPYAVSDLPAALAFARAPLGVE